jgi:hypothetical protein
MHVQDSRVGASEQHWQTFSAAADGTIWFWADAICTDQSPGVNAASQFKLRRFIFQRARRVVAWLPSSSVHHEFELVHLEQMVATVKGWAQRYQAPESLANKKDSNGESILDVMDRFLTG